MGIPYWVMLSVILLQPLPVYLLARTKGYVVGGWIAYSLTSYFGFFFATLAAFGPDTPALVPEMIFWVCQMPLAFVALVPSRKKKSN